MSDHAAQIIADAINTGSCTIVLGLCGHALSRAFAGTK